MTTFNPGTVTTLVEVLKRRAEMTPNKIAYRFLVDGENQEQTITYSELDQRAKIIASQLQRNNPKIHSERVLLVYPQGIEFIAAFFGCLYAGATAVLVYPPTSKKMSLRIEAIVEDCDIDQVLSVDTVIDKMKSLNILDAEGESKLSSLTWMDSLSIDTELAGEFEPAKIDRDDIAFLQYTSGSTGTPKGVMVSHGNLMANQEAIQELYQHDDDTTVFVGWLPLIHDMGLIGNVLQPMYLGIPLTFMAPLHFVQKPLRWLKAIEKYQATTSGGPNFAYDLCLKKIDEKSIAQLDLSSWNIAFNGAEPVRSETIQKFTKKFAPAKLNPLSHMPVYGLAEATLIVTGTQVNQDVPTDAEKGYVSSGKPASMDVVKVVNPETFEESKDGEEGEIWVSGPSVAKGYWNRPEVSKETFQARVAGDERDYLRTGDTGYSHNGELMVTGRIKDVIIVGGRNYHAEDVEWSIHNVDGIRPGCCAAFSVLDLEAEKIVMVAGLLPTHQDQASRIAQDIRSKVYEDHQINVDEVVFIKPKELPMTTSGKVQRRRARQMLLDSEFAILATDLEGSSNGNEESSDFLAAATPAERELAQTWSNILGVPVDEVGMHDNFFKLGGSSLTMLELANELNVTMELLFRYPTIHSYLYRTSEYEFPKVEEDIYLPPARIDATLNAKTHITLITGGTGFFGLHFLQSMMARSEDKFVVLVRGKDQEALQKKFDDAVDYFDMESSIDRERVILVQGDLSKHHLGIPDEQYDWVCENVDRIVHIGSHVNNWLPYEGIREINVDGTRSLLELARTGRKKEMHYTSTSTFSPDKEDQSVFLESDDIDALEINRYFGYDISKYASEAMCKIARDEGLVCNIYRLVWVGGHLATGLTKLNDGFNIMLRILLTIKAFPQGNYLHDIVPVDLMADSMASVLGKAENMDFNITSQSKESIDMKRIATMLRGMGYQLDEVSRAEFVDRLKNYPIELWDEHCKSYRQLVIRLFEDPTPKVESFYDSANYCREMDPAVLEKMEQKFIDEWFDKTVSFLVRNDALPTPSGSLYSNEINELNDWNLTSKPYTLNQTLHHYFSQQAEATPNNVAVSDSEGSLTYLELETRSNQIAASLIASDVQRGEMVGLSVNRSNDLIASVLGILKAGACYVPLDPTYPANSLAYMIEDSHAEIIVTDHQSSVKLSEFDKKIVCLDSDVFEELSSMVRQDAVNKRCSEVSESDLAYVIYTSGTTGKPKGVMVQHRSVINHCLNMVEHFDLTESDKLLQFATVNFDSFIEEVFPVLFSGASLVMTEQGNLTNVDSYRSIIESKKVTVLKMSTAFWHTISDLNVESLGVRLLGVGGEEADVHKYNQWRKNNPNVAFVNTYGPTETTVTVTLSHIAGSQEKLTIGRPLANIKAYVLDKNLKQVPIGFVGELYIGGEGVTLGYLNKPQQTQEVFLDNPFEGEGHIYRTGDLVRWTAEGELEFLGRADSQVKVRGYRIELSAIETEMGCLEDLQDVAVVVKEVDTRKKIIAYYTCESESLGPKDIHTYLEHQLPSYMIPNMFIRLDTLPMNPNGKVDRKLLEDMEIQANQNNDFATPTTEAEIKVAQVWERLLNVSNVGLNDEFMELGGHSLIVMSMINELGDEFGRRIGINEFYEHPTVGKLAHYLESGEDHSSDSNLIKFPDLPGMVPGKTTGAVQTSPLFMVHGLGGHLASFYPLVKNLKERLLDKYNTDTPVYGLEANGFKDDQTYFQSLEEMVETYVELILKTQESGPYLLGGWSYGVSVAYHVAQELVARGHEVAAFISIDAEAPNVPKDFEEFIQENQILELDDLYEDNRLSSLLKKFGQRFGFVGKQDENAKEQFYRFLGYANTEMDSDLERFSKVAISNLFNARGFKPAPIKLPNAMLVKATNSRFDNYHSDWHDLLESKLVSTLTLNGDHWSIMQDPELADHLASYVANHFPSLDSETDAALA